MYFIRKPLQMTSIFQTAEKSTSMIAFLQSTKSPRRVSTVMHLQWCIVSHCTSVKAKAPSTWTVDTWWPKLSPGGSRFYPGVSQQGPSPSWEWLSQKLTLPTQNPVGSVRSACSQPQIPIGSVGRGGKPSSLHPSRLSCGSSWPSWHCLRLSQWSFIGWSNCKCN